MKSEQKYLPYGRQCLTQGDIDAVVAVLKSDFLTQGPTVEAFEKAIAEYLGCSDVIVMNNATAALHIAYLSLGVEKGSAVIVPAITFAATANAAVYCGGVPFFCDVDPVSGLMTPELLEQAVIKCKAQGLKPKLCVPVHYAGMAVDMNGIIEVAKKHSMKVFEDACHAIGGDIRASETSPWRKVGNAFDGSAGCSFSFHPVKHIATGEGGAVATNDPEFAKKLRLIRTHGITKSSENFVDSKMAFDKKSGLVNPWYYEMQELGWNYRLSDINAALGLSQMGRLVANIQKRRQIATWYHENLSGLPLVRPCGETILTRHAWHLYPLLIDFENIGVSRFEMFRELKQRGVGAQVHYIPVPSLPYYKKSGAVVPPGARKFYDMELSIPMYPDLTRADVDRVSDALKDILTPSKKAF
jgi:UDP-4-amino-4,6-dideoxy-N-acetyl-beta-L-altrosamine transaminase